MKIHHLTADEARHSLQTPADGLSENEAARRLHEFGPNQVERIQGESLALRLLKNFTHFFALILWLAAGLALFAEFSDPGQGMLLLAGAIVGVIVINGLFAFWQEYRAEQALAALQKLLPHQVKALRAATVRLIPAAELVPGDVLLLEAGDDVPADCRLIEAFGVRVNIATVTGESLPKARDARVSAEEELIHSRNVLLAGTSMVSGEARAVVFATGMHTEFGRIAHLTQSAVKVRSPLQQEISRLSRLVAVLATLLGVVFFMLGQGLGLSFWENLIFAIGIIVANVPEGLLPTVTLALAMGGQRMAKRQALIRHLPSVETLGSTTVICTDKTGTLTQNRMAVKRLYLDGIFIEAGDILKQPEIATRPPPLFETLLRCHDLKHSEANGQPLWLGDPMEIALVELAQRVMPESPVYPRVDEIPFDSDRKRMSTLHATPAGLRLYTKGALESLLPQCVAVLVGGNREPLTPAMKDRLLQAEQNMAHQGLRVIATAFRPVPESYEAAQLEASLILTGLVGLDDPPRPEVPEAIRQCRAAGIRVIMITGDHPHTALAVARAIGLVRSEAARIITGEQLRRLSDAQLQLALDTKEILFARIGADQKRRIVIALKHKREIVAVTGDGVNDAPALKEAHIGISMGITGTDVAKESADMILLDDNFASIVAAIEEGRAVFDNIRKFLTYILTSNIPEIVPYLAFVLFKIPLPLTIIQILAVDLGTDMLPALALGAERPDPRIMQRPPRPAAQRLLDLPLLARAYLFLGILEAAAAMAAFFFVLHSGGWHYGEALADNDLLYLQATTACLTAIVLMQVLNVYLCRSEHDSLLANGLFTNPLILWGIGVELALALFIVYTPWGNLLFGTAPISGAVWLFVLPFAGTLVGLEEARKAWVRRRNAARPVAT
jgi:calcium-translocating P-type ATPase